MDANLKMIPSSSYIEILMENLKDALSVNTLYSTDEFFSELVGITEIQFISKNLILSQVSCLHTP